MSTGRMSTARRQHIKARLAERDGARCFFCAVPFVEGLKGVTIDHLIPFRRFPRNLQENLVLACQACNVAKDDQSPEKFLRISVEELAARCGRPVADVRKVLRSPTAAAANTRYRVLTAMRCMAAQPQVLAVSRPSTSPDWSTAA
jgi:ferredoxin